MKASIDIYNQDTNAEIVARIVKAASRKYSCNLNIDFQEGNRIMEFVGDETKKPLIAEDVQRIFAFASQA